MPRRCPLSKIGAVSDSEKKFAQSRQPLALERYSTDFRYAHWSFDETAGDFAGEVEWNFGKFLVDRNGAVIARFNPGTNPEDAVVVGAIEKALAAQAAK